MTRRTRPTRTAAAALGIAVGLVLGLPLGWTLAEVRRGRREAAHYPVVPPDEPPFAAEMAGVPRHPGEWL